MGEKLLIKNGRVIDPKNGLDKICDLLIADEKIAAIGDIDQASSDAKVIDASGKIVAPGLIDIHVHFREPGDEEEETIASGSEAAVKAGFTSVVCMPNTDPTIQSETDVEYIHRKGRQARKTHVYVMGAITKNRQGKELAEMGFMSRAGAVGFTDDGSGVQSSAIMAKALKYTAMFDTVISQHCQNNEFAADGVMNAGYDAAVLGLSGMNVLAEEAMLWRDVQLVKQCAQLNVKYHAQHISTAGSVEIITKAKNDGLNVTCEVTPHHLLLTQKCCENYDTNYKVNPPLRTERDIEALKKAIKEGIIDVLATDHAPHLQSEKELEFLTAPFGIASLECALSLYEKALISSGIIDWPKMLEMMTINPAKIIGIDDNKGSFDIGKQADVTIINPDAQYEINVNAFVSKSKNCPYHNWPVKAKIVATIVGGEIRYSASGQSRCQS